MRSPIWITTKYIRIGRDCYSYWQALTILLILFILWGAFNFYLNLFMLQIKPRKIILNKSSKIVKAEWKDGMFIDTEQNFSEEVHQFVLTDYPGRPDWEGIKLWIVIKDGKFSRAHWEQRIQWQLMNRIIDWYEFLISAAIVNYINSLEFLNQK